MPVNSKQNLIMRLGVIVLVVTLLLTVFVGGTYAKYTTALYGSDTARVAAFHIDGFGESTTSVDVFSTAYKGVGEYADIDTVRSDKYVVAPGTEGSFDVCINYFMEVDSYYDLTFEEIQTPAEANIPIIYSVDNGANWYDAPSLHEAIERDVDTMIEAGSGQKVTKILWKWAFDESMQNAHVQSNEMDTILGLDAQAEIVLRVSLAVNQID